MAEISNELIHKLMLEIQSEQKAMRADMQQGFTALREELARTNQKIDGQATTLVGIRRDIRALQTDVGMLLSAVDDHTRRIAAIEKGNQPPPAHV